jgi:uncharacterized membrane protein
MSSHSALVFVRLIHVLAGTFWVGVAVFVATSMLPAIRAAGPAGNAVMRYLTVVQRLPYILLTAGALALLSGGYLVWIDSTGSLESWMQSGQGMTYLIGAIAAVLAAAIGVGLNIPTANRLGRLGAAQAQGSIPASVDQANLAAGLARRLIWGTRVAAVLLVIALSSMAVARYVG